LHLYEWFPKWYVGEGTEFKKIVPKMLYSNLIWKNTSGQDNEKRRKKEEDLLTLEDKNK
jgi:hypothetical protein